MKLHFGHLLALSALLIAGCAAFFSVYGLSQLFAGASLAVIVMASALEFSKIIATSFLHKYWGEIGKTLKIYLTIGVAVLVTITSAGIYGFLSNAYQITANDLDRLNNETSLYDNKIIQFETKITSNTNLIDLKTKRVNQLNESRSNQENRLDVGKNTWAIRNDIKIATDEIKNMNSEIDNLVVQNNTLLDSISSLKTKKFEVVGSSKVTGEIGPLKYISELTKAPMDKIVNYFILLLIFVFDPLAIALVIATNWVFERKINDRNYNLPKNKPLVIEENENYVNNIPLIEEDNNIIDEPIDIHEPIDVHEEIIDSINVEKTNDLESEPPIVESTKSVVPIVKSEEPIIDLNEPRKMKIEDIKEIKERNRGFSNPIPDMKNSVSRIDSEKININKNTKNMFYKK